MAGGMWPIWPCYSSVFLSWKAKVPKLPKLQFMPHEARWCFLFASDTFGCVHSKLDWQMHRCLRGMPCCCSDCVSAGFAGEEGKCGHNPLTSSSPPCQTWKWCWHAFENAKSLKRKRRHWKRVKLRHHIWWERIIKRLGAVACHGPTMRHSPLRTCQRMLGVAFKSMRCCWTCLGRFGWLLVSTCFVPGIRADVKRRVLGRAGALFRRILLMEILELYKPSATCREIEGWSKNSRCSADV